MTTSHDPSSSSKSRPPAISAADTVHEALEELERLCEDIEHFIIHLAHRAQYRAPIIDWHHADEYAQKDIVGLKKFLAAAEAERQYVEGLSTGPIIPKDFTSNSPHILAVWHEFTRAPWPLTSIGQAIEYDDPATSANSASSSTHKAGDAKAKQKGKQHVKGGKLARQGKTGVKVDVVCKGGDEWIKVNTMKESRLLQEFREQDSYINSDYDSDPDSDVDVRAASGSLGNCPNEPDDPRGHSSEYQSNGCKQNGRQTRHLRSPPPLTNSLISQAESLLYAAKHVPLLPGRRRPTIRLILPRLQPMLPPSLSPSPSTSSSSVASSRSTFDSMLWQDVRTGQTLDHLTKMGITVQLGPTPTPAWEAGEKVPLIPTRKILLDLSVLVALCCESSHMALPRDEGEHQARFRAMRIVHDHDCPDAPIGPEGEQGAVSKVSYGRAGDDGPGQGKMHGTNGNGAMAATSDERRHRCRGINHVADAVTPRGGSRGDQIDPYTAAPRLELGPHTNASRDLSDQLAWESQHPLIGELRDRLTLPRSTSSSQTTEPERIGASGRPGHMTEGAEASGPVEFWVTQEVYKRLPGLVDIIGGPGERARARALFAHAQSATVGVDEPTDDDDHNEVDGTNDTNGTKGQEDDGAAFAGMIQQKAGDGSSIGRNADFWRGSRWEGKEGVLAGLRVRVLPGTDMEDDFDFEQATPIGSASGDGAGAAAKPSLDEKMADLDIAPDGHLTTDGGQASTSASARTSSNSMVGASSRSPFASCLVDACHALLAASQSTSTSTPSNGFPLASPGTPKRDRRNRHRPSTLSVHHTTRLPSGHTLRTLMHGAARGWTVLTNNRGAVGKVCREMGIGEGLGVGDMRAQENGQGGEEWTEGQERQVERQGEEAAVWIVNPSSLSEWRRREVEKENERVRAEWDALMGQECAGPGIREVGER